MDDILKRMGDCFMVAGQLSAKKAAEAFRHMDVNGYHQHKVNAGLLQDLAVAFSQGHEVSLGERQEGANVEGSDGGPLPSGGAASSAQRGPRPYEGEGQGEPIPIRREPRARKRGDKPSRGEDPTPVA